MKFLDGPEPPLLRCFGCDRTTRKPGIMTLLMPLGKLLCPDCRPAFDNR